MKSSFPYHQQGGGYFLTQRRRTLDIVASTSGKKMIVTPVARRRQSFVRPILQGESSFDGIQHVKSSFVARLQKHSLRDMVWRIIRKSELYIRRMKRVTLRLMPDIAPRKMLYGSLTAGVVFGIVSMGFIEHFFGPGVFARSDSTSTSTGQIAGASTTTASEETSLSDNTSPEQSYDSSSDIFFEYFNEAADEQYKESVRDMVKGYPIEEMLPYIFEQDRLVAAFLVGIAKKESNWGKRVPVLDGQDCFNYWGYRGIRRMMGTGGHTCFNSRKDAVETVAKRLNTLINSQQLNTPEKMIIWKCGFSCSGHSRESVRKWIADVDMYFKQLSDE